MATILRTTSSHPAFSELIAQLDSFLAELNGTKNDFYAKLNVVDDIPTVVLAELDGQFVGCGAFRPKSDGVVEIKRMYVLPAFRGQAIGQLVLAALELWANEQGHTRAELETSKRLTSAVALYTKAGYSVIPNFAPYEDVDDSVCMAKGLC